LLEAVAPDAEVLAANPNCARTPEGSITRRARVRHCLDRRGACEAALEEFIETDLDNVSPCSLNSTLAPTAMRGASI